MFVIASQFAVELEVNIAQHILKTQRVRFGLIEQDPIEARLPEREGFGGERRLAHPAEAGDDGDGLLI